MRWLSRTAERALRALDRAPGNERPFEPATSLAPPSGRRRSWVHYGVMLPGLPEPHRAFNVMAVVGTPGASFVANDQLIATSPRDTAYVVSATSSMTSGQFSAYAVHDQCELASDGSVLRFGDDLIISGRHPSWQVRRAHPDVEVELTLTATPAVTRFIRLPGVYNHWSLLCRARGRVGSASVDALCTLEYAHGVSVHSLVDRRLPSWLQVPVPFFTYHVLNADDRTQLLFTDVRGPDAIALQRAVHIRSMDGTTSTLRAGHRFDVHASETCTTPDGRTMRLPREFTWAADGVEVHGRTHSDFVYGLGAGYVGTYEYEGRFAGRPISGCAYLEYVDLRSGLSPV